MSLNIKFSLGKMVLKKVPYEKMSTGSVKWIVLDKPEKGLFFQ